MMKESCLPPESKPEAPQETPCKKCPFAREIGAKAVSRANLRVAEKNDSSFVPPKGSTIEFALNNPKRYREIIEDTYTSMQKYRRDVLEIPDSDDLWQLQRRSRRRSLIDKVVGYIRDAMR